jgi:uncharacterized membrane protein YkvA (DUF1232 family)
VSPQNRIAHWKTRVAELRSDTYALYLACRDPRVPWFAKAIVGLVVAYALSPIDLIPDFIPVLGYLDDLVLIPLGIALAVRLIPPDVLAEHRRNAKQILDSDRRRSRVGATIVVAIWSASAIWFGWMAWRFAAA